MFFNGIQKAINGGFFEALPRRDQNELLQKLYDKGYSVKEIAKELDTHPQMLYSRINAHRGRGPQLQPS